jgi:hypothetical protein
LWRKKKPKAESSSKGNAPAAARKQFGERYKAFLREHPNGTFAEYYTYDVQQRLNEGQSHKTLGTKIENAELGEGEIEFTEAGRERFEKFRKLMKLKPHHRVVDYGCGSLRIGYHMMNYLEPGNYFGLDVTTDFIDIGKSLIGDSLAKRKPHLAAISAKSVAEAKAFAPDFVFSSSVAIHVHPKEAATYYGNLQILTSKPGAELFFNARISDKPQRIGENGWSWPKSYYVDALPDLKFMAKKKGGMLNFRRRRKH